MEDKVINIILKALESEYGKDNVSYEEGNIYVSDSTNTGACEISIRYEE